MRTSRFWFGFFWVAFFGEIDDFKVGWLYAFEVFAPTLRESSDGTDSFLF